MQVEGHKCDKCPFKLTCENCFLELTLYVPDQYTIEQYIEKTAPFANVHLKAITRQEDSIYMLEADSGQILKDVKFDLTYICKVSIENKKQITSQSKQCPNYAGIEESELSIKTVIYKKPSTSQEIKLPIEKLSTYI
jgi:hypothetical protein